MKVTRVTNKAAAPRASQGKATEAPRREAVSFVMVLWLESREETSRPEWRWRVVRVQTGKEAYFRQLAKLLAFVSAEAGVPPPE